MSKKLISIWHNNIQRLQQRQISTNLGNDGQLSPQSIQRDAGSIHTIQKDAPRVHINQPEQRKHQAALAAACTPHNAT
jgi:hypothetical protein